MSSKPKESPRECIICCTDSLTFVQCVCGFETCTECAKRTILEGITEAHCMEPKCKRKWTNKFMLQNFNSVWVNGLKPGQYRHFLKKILLDREVSKIPETLAIINFETSVAEWNEKTAQLRDIASNLDRQLYNSAWELMGNDSYDKYCNYINTNSYDIRYADTPAALWACVNGISTKTNVHLKLFYELPQNERQEYFTLYSKRSGLTNEIVTTILTNVREKSASLKLEHDRIMNTNEDCKRISQELLAANEARTTHYIIGCPRWGASTAQSHIAYICPCPTEDCKGMIAKDTHACVVCKTVVCEDCHEPIPGGDASHQCNPDAVKTVALLKKDSRACPTCATLIYRISGCDQMFCTSCNTSFCWRTGLIETGIVHNPHALEYLRTRRQLARNPADIPCGGLINQVEMTDIKENVYSHIKKTSGYVSLKDMQAFDRFKNLWAFCAECSNAVQDGKHRIIEHEYTGVGYIYDLTSQDSFGYLRYEYVKGWLSEKDWRQKIFLRERAFARGEMINSILQTFVTLTSERYRNLLQVIHETEDSATVITAFNETCTELHNIIKFVNDTFREELPPLGATVYKKICHSKIDSCTYKLTTNTDKYTREIV